MKKIDLEQITLNILATVFWISIGIFGVSIIGGLISTIIGFKADEVFFISGLVSGFMGVFSILLIGGLDL